ncbi:GNAT family N-acetyltransferase [Nocardia donostiensis]|nr:GNAT family N-acetyltransferase [Nocardia donostiensis]
MAIRQIGQDEWETARTVRLDALAGSPPGTFAATHAEASTWDEQQWRQWTERRALFIAERDGAPVGSAGGIVTEGKAELVSMWTAPVVRGTGVSDRLVRAVAAWALVGGYPELRLWFVEGNEHAEKLYRRNGFVRTGRERPYAADDPRPEHEMMLLLAVTDR